MSLRITINTLILLVASAALGILLYCIINFKKVVNKAINTTLLVVKENKPIIQPVISDFANSTADNLLNNKSIIQKGTDVITTQMQNVLNDGTLDGSLTKQSTRVLNNDQTKIAVSNIINSPVVTKAISNAIISALGGNMDYNDLTSEPSAFENALINNINNPGVANAIGNAVKNYPNNQSMSISESGARHQHTPSHMHYKNNYNIKN
jgi:hypothetical protein